MRLVCGHRPPARPGRRAAEHMNQRLNALPASVSGFRQPGRSSVLFGTFRLTGSLDTAHVSALDGPTNQARAESPSRQGGAQMVTADDYDRLYRSKADTRTGEAAE